MKIWREVGRRYVVWLLMFSVTAAALTLVGKPPEVGWGREHAGFVAQVLLAGSLIAVNLAYFCARVNDERVNRGLAACLLAAFTFFPDYIWGTLGAVFGGLNPVISALLVIALAALALNVGFHVSDALAGRAGRPS